VKVGRGVVALMIVALAVPVIVSASDIPSPGVYEGHGTERARGAGIWTQAATCTATRSALDPYFS
jgi:hypothetical protein